jgi:glucose/arabinose dehydrogenase
MPRLERRLFLAFVLAATGCSERDFTELTAIDVGAAGGSVGVDAPQAEPDASLPEPPPDQWHELDHDSGTSDKDPDSGAARPPELALLSQLPVSLRLNLGAWSTEPVFGALTFDDPVALAQAPRTNRLYVAEREGRLYTFEREPTVTSKVLALDLSSITQGDGDSGLLGFVFHPAFAAAGADNRPYVFVHHSFTETPVVGERPPNSNRTRSRLSRFTVDLTTGVIDPASELLLIDQDDEAIDHQGGAMFFHPRDGFLYLTVGDEGGRACRLDNCQRIDKDLFSGVLRLDVDMRGGAISHPIVRQPLDGVTANYFVPNDNPFVGQPGVLEEFYAIGLRSPHKLTYDPVDDIGWIGDVGLGDREEIDVLRRGANYQWPVMEGFLQRTAVPSSVIGAWTPPLLDLPRDEAHAVIGGYVYRGARLPELQGRYIFGDYPSGRIWAVSYEPRGSEVQLLQRDLLLETPFNTDANSITSFGTDADGELYILTLGPGTQLQHIIASAPATNAPPTLALASLDLPRALAATQRAFPYDVQSPLWSDGARKQRWLVLPEDATIELTPTGPWHFPDGTVFVKQFSMALDEADSSRLTPLETRFLVAGEGGNYYGLSYEWDAGGRSANVVLQRRIKSLTVRQQDGTTRSQRYEIPGPLDCLVCHNAEAGHVLGVRTEQLNHDEHDPLSSLSENQLLTWSRRGVFSQPLDALDVAGYPRLPSPSDPNAPVEARVRAYWASNCSMCHGVNPDIRAYWDARYATPLDEQGIVLGPLATALDGASVVVAPGDPQGSALFVRSATTGPLRMPPLGRRRTDPQYIELLQGWIEGLPLPVDAGAP